MEFEGERGTPDFTPVALVTRPRALVTDDRVAAREHATIGKAFKQPRRGLDLFRALAQRRTPGALQPLRQPITRPPRLADTLGEAVGRQLPRRVRELLALQREELARPERALSRPSVWRSSAEAAPHPAAQPLRPVVEALTSRW